MATFIKIAAVELTGTQSSIEFTSIPSTFTDLCLKYSARTDRSNQNSDIYLQFNGVTTSTYSFKRIYGAGSGTAASDGLTNNSAGGFAGTACGASSTSSTFGNSEIYIPNYAGSTAKSWSVDGVNENNGTGVLNALYTGLWSGTSTITSIVLKDYNGASFVQYSVATLYGIKK